MGAAGEDDRTEALSGSRSALLNGANLALLAIAIGSGLEQARRPSLGRRLGRRVDRTFFLPVAREGS